MFKKHILSFSLCLVTASQAIAGGLVTNSNQSASFLRNPARDAVIDIDGVYTNPAGISFMPLGFHLGFTLQHPEQERNITTTFPTLARNINHFGESTRKFHGQASAPIVPSFQAAYVWKRWTAMASFAFSGGGGKCEFDDGIGSIESIFSLLPSFAQMKDIPAAGYSLNSFMKGRQYYLGIQLGAGYKINDHLAVSAGLRSVIGTATYTGYVKDIALYAADGTQLPQAVLGGIMQAMGDPTGTGEIDMTTDQSCIGWTPVIGIDWRINDHWNIAAKYEFRTKMSLKNTSTMNDFARSQPTLDKFNDKKNEKVRDDIPTTITFGAQYSPISTVRINGGFHFYDDCNAKKFNNEEELIDRGTVEFLLGAEWDATKWLTVSGGWQNTSYGLSDEYMQDMSFNCSSNMLALGVRLKASEKISVDLGYMHNFYKDRTVETKSNIAGIELAKKDVYERTNAVFAIGVNMDF